VDDTGAVLTLSKSVENATEKFNVAIIFFIINISELINYNF
jgi:hypothetical protein